MAESNLITQHGIYVLLHILILVGGFGIGIAGIVACVREIREGEWF